MLIPAITGGRSRGRGSASAANGRAEQSDKNKDLFIAVQVYPNSVFDGQDRVDFSRPHDDVQSESSSPMLRFPTHRDDSRNDILRTIRQDVIGSGSTMQTPYGEKLIVYTDWTASGRALGRVEDVIKNEVLQSYANTHTESSYTGAQTTKFRDQARKAVLKSVNGDEACDCVVFAGSGSSAAIEKLQQVLGLSHRKSSKLRNRPVIFVSSAEHHSNLISWKENHCDVEVIPMAKDGRIDIGILEARLRASRYRKLKMGSFSAASNITGIHFQVKEITRLLHRHGALAFWDYAAAGAYAKIELTDHQQPDLSLDAVFLSPHKFVGAAGGTPGVLAAKRHLFQNGVPSFAGGGTVKWVYSVDKYKFDPVIENREEGGTPAIVASIRCGLVFRLKDMVGAEAIHEREMRLFAMARNRWEKHPNLTVLGGFHVERLAIFSFLILPPSASRSQWLHHNFVCAVLNDVFGIQARGGCSCAGPYGSFLLGIPETINPEIIPDYLKPGWTRVSLNYFISDEEAQYIIDAVAMVADMGHMLLPYYEFNEETGNWHSISDATEHLMSLKDLDITGFGPEKSENLTSATSATWRQDAEDERHLKMEQQMASAMILFEHLSAEGQPEVVVTAPAAKANKHRWYILPGEALRTIRVANDIRWQANDELLPALTKEEPPQIARDACVAIDPSKAPFLTTPWYSYGSEINGMSPGLKYMNENAVRARAGLLNATGWMSAFLILYLPPVYGVRPFLVIKYLASIALWEMLAGVCFGLTPLAPYGVLATLMTRGQPPHWKPAAPKRFAWCLGVILLSACLVVGALQLRWVAFALAVACVMLTGMEAAFGFCLGCWMYNLVAKILGRSECQECRAPAGPIEGLPDAIMEAAISHLTTTHSHLIFSKSTCSHCKRAMRHLQSLGKDYHVVELDKPEGQALVPSLQRITKQYTVPYIFVQGKFVGGASDLIATMV